MLRLTKLTDYAIVILTHFSHGAHEDGSVLTARGIAQSSRLPLPTVSKVLKALARAGILASQRGVSGGYNLARAPKSISIADVIAAIEGPISLTECSGPPPELCEHERACPCRSSWQRINQVVRAALETLSIVDMATTDVAFAHVPHADQLVRIGSRRNA